MQVTDIVCGCGVGDRCGLYVLSTRLDFRDVRIISLLG